MMALRASTTAMELGRWIPTLGGEDLKQLCVGVACLLG
jgi:hypothetical protein